MVVMKKLSVLISAVLALAFHQCLADGSPIKFGKVNDNELKMSVYDLDSSAHAAILCDYGETWFEYDRSGDKGFQVYFKRTVRIKVFDEEGVNAGDSKIILYQSNGSDREKLIETEGITFNLENEKIVKTKLENKSIMEKEEDKYHIASTFAMPNVRQGSVIDITYTIKSDFLFNIQPWSFQYLIPVKWSEYYVKIPEYFIYKHTLLGYNSLAINENSTQMGNITFVSSERSGGMVTKTTYNNENISYKESCYRLVMKDIPAFKEETFLTTSSNYRSIYSFELSSTKSINNVYKDYTNTWEKINELLLDDENFGKRIKSAGFIRDEIEELISGIQDTTEKVIIVYEFLKNRMRWNLTNSLTSDDLKKPYSEGNGTSADINLLLIKALREAGIDAQPVALSTRKNGMINPAHPSLTDFNYVIALVKINGKNMLLDATEPDAPAGLLPERCLNDKGRIISEKNADWISLNPEGSDKRTSLYTLALSPDGNITGIVSHKREFYNALNYRKDIHSASSSDDFYKELEKETEGLIYNTINLTDLDSIYNPVGEEIGFSFSNGVEMNGDIILLNPLLFENTSENPFKLKERNYPVELPYPINELLIFTYELPPGFTTEDLPKPAMVTLPSNAGKFVYNVTLNGNTLMITSTVQIKKTLFIPAEYETLKEFFNLLISKQSEQIVIRKT
jgi:hypothetical protein